MKKLATTWNADAAMSRALATLSRPPRDGIERHGPVGSLVVRFVLPLDLCPGVNKLGEMPGWARKKLKGAALGEMLKQAGFRRQAQPLPGRPMVRVVRFSSNEGDRDQGFSKVPVDRLTRGKRKRPKGLAKDVWRRVQATAPPIGLNYLRDDRPKDADVRVWWEPAPPGQGCVLVEVWTGETMVERRSA